MTTRLTGRFEEAFCYAAVVHAGQTRKGVDVPYIAHLMAVAAIVLEDDGDEDEAIAALLHDAAEDQGGRERLEDIRIRFGDKVAGIVEGCTDSFTTPKPPWAERKQAYVVHVRHATPEVVRVSAADKVHNVGAIVRDLRRIGDRVWDRFNASRDEVVWYYSALVDAFREAGDGPLVEELARRVAELNALVRKSDARG